ncbi:MAG: hypothetical protein CO029_01805 [Candidatus Magasanikbacteria bacterium CG_4_9_14_0_2_um_filter_41_10]|uniref:DUF5667 domain-containing protein n=1 Tax=Candidatus Magasanikbacteria bacterium CG_4_10_14_0_2_um_filter_41_31 TaxID=1974639 RepID=A0A2M7V3D8_9BACT|nr:MAG: hypothetical protein AUJ37_01185 [Candidatus Magasanikbacteria bacterium CG1_02_41_34]PIZ92996.1 MAG: hypothetical protein COX83_03025 [Candidatus Magasanikbacteria bacterium CG_4_10_14_0_2_um_filter_41_31]PJC53611.1 MAG: hypothetical protein CO029_01805 [Candidatus Magasanikbacteria bacterium CG_4_9_14_0_2_um_filter_41_10]
MSRILKAQLKKVKNLEGRINPDQAWVARTKTSLLQTIASETIVATTPVRAMVGKKRAEQMLQGFQAFFPKNIFSQARPVFISLLVFLLAGSGWIASASASESLPGDTLWQVKLASEKTQIVLASITGNDKKNVALQLKFAARRADEIKIVTGEEKFAPEEKAKRAGEGLKQLQENIASVDTAVHSDEQKEDISKGAKELNESTAQISATLKEVASTVQDGDADATLTKQVAAAQQAVDEVGINAVKVAVEGAQNDVERTAAQVLVEEKIVSVLSDADGALSKNAEAKALIENVDVSEGTDATHVSSTIALNDAQASSTTVTTVTSVFGTTSTVKGISTEGDGVVPSQTTKQMVTAILEQADKTSEAVQAQVDQIKQLISNNDLTGALEKAKELKRTTVVSTLQTLEINKTVEQVTNATQTKTSVVPSSSVTPQKTILVPIISTSTSKI